MNDVTQAARQENRRRFFDLLIRSLLGALFAVAAGASINTAVVDFRALDPTHTDMHIAVARILSITSVALYAFMVACLYVLRLRPVSKFPGLMPTLGAWLGSFLLIAVFLFPPRTDLPLEAQITACVLLLTGNSLSLYILSKLGRSFSILPEGRRLVTTGPYRFVRHPLYLAESLSSFGILISFWSVGAAIVVLAQLSFQFVRMHYEEKVLRDVFPEYADYAKHTPRVFPGII